MKITRRQLSLIIENFLIEHNKDEFEELLLSGIITQDDFNDIYKQNNPKGIFKDSFLRQTLYNTLVAQQGHSIDDFADSTPTFKQKILDPYHRGELRPVQIPGTLNQFDLAKMLDDGEATYDHFQSYITIKDSTNLGRSKHIQNVLNSGFAGDTTHFEVIYDSNDWIVVYPKTYKGSISTARMGPDKRYYIPPNVIGEMNWCTSVDSSGNLFLNYHVAKNLHMYYLTRKAGYDPNNKYRKMCISFSKRGKSISIDDGGHATVDGNNDPITKRTITRVIGKDLLKLLTDDVKKPEREEIDEKQFYKSVSYEQYISLRQQNVTKEDLELFTNEAIKYLQNSEVDQILESISNDVDLIFANPSFFIYVNPIYVRSETAKEVLSSNNRNAINGIISSGIVNNDNIKILMPEYINNPEIVLPLSRGEDPLSQELYNASISILPSLSSAELYSYISGSRNLQIKQHVIEYLSTINMNDSEKQDLVKSMLNIHHPNYIEVANLILEKVDPYLVDKYAIDDIARSIEDRETFYKLYSFIEKKYSEHVDKKEFYLKAGIARNPAAPQELIFAIYDEIKENLGEEKNIFQAFARNRNCPKEIIIELFNHPNPENKAMYMINVMSRRDKVPDDLLSIIYNEYKRGGLPDYIYVYIAMQENLPDEAKYEIANSNDADAKIYLANQETLTKELAQILLKDKSKEVRDVIKRRIRNRDFNLV